MDNIWLQSLTAIAVIAAGFKGFSYLIRSGWKSFESVRKVLHALHEIGSEESWPNGSKSLPQAMSEIYRRQSETYAQAAKNAEVVQAHLDKHNNHLWETEAGIEGKKE